MLGDGEKEGALKGFKGAHGSSLPVWVQMMDDLLDLGGDDEDVPSAPPSAPAPRAHHYHMQHGLLLVSVLGHLSVTVALPLVCIGGANDVPEDMWKHWVAMAQAIHPVASLSMSHVQELVRM